MAEYLIQSETLTNMADKIRVLNGVEGAMTPAQMDGNLGEVNVEVDEQTDLIAQIASALEGKAGGEKSVSLAYLTNGTLPRCYTIPFMEGMTWADFIASDYNIIYVIQTSSINQYNKAALLIENPDGSPGLSDSQYHVPYDLATSKLQVLSDIIIPGRMYIFLDTD